MNKQTKARRAQQSVFSNNLKELLLSEAEELEVETKGKYKIDRKLKRLLEC